MRKPESRREAVIKFVGEQDGPPERGLKTAIRQILAEHGGVSAAYLARVSYGDDSTINVILGLRAKEDPNLVRMVAECFHKMFAKGTHLDILFLSDSQWEQLTRVCAPFFSSTLTGPNQSHTRTA